MAVDPVDAHVGARIRSLRKQMRLTQTDLAIALGVTFQQVQKYERGANRISASMMMRAARFLEVSPAFFFDGADELPDQPGPISPFLAMSDDRCGLEIAASWSDLNPVQKQSLVDLAAAYRRQSMKSGEVEAAAASKPIWNTPRSRMWP